MSMNENEKMETFLSFLITFSFVCILWNEIEKFGVSVGCENIAAKKSKQIRRNAGILNM